MGLGSVTLLEIKDVPTGKRIAYSLLSGEFIFVAETCAPEFGATKAIDLYGANLFQHLTLRDTEKLEDFLQAQHVDSNSNHTRVLVRLLSNSNTQLWIQLSTIPLTLRMMRCIDTIRSLSSPLGQFADSSSFVLSEDEFSSVLANFPRSTESEVALNIEAPLSTDDDEDFLLFEYENSYLSPTNMTATVPLELKHHHPNYAITHSHLDDTETEATTDNDDELKASLSSLAFEADWCSETCPRNTEFPEAISSTRSASIATSRSRLLVT